MSGHVLRVGLAIVLALCSPAWCACAAAALMRDRHEQGHASPSSVSSDADDCCDHDIQQSDSDEHDDSDRDGDCVCCDMVMNATLSRDGDDTIASLDIASFATVFPIPAHDSLADAPAGIDRARDGRARCTLRAGPSAPLYAQRCLLLV